MQVLVQVDRQQASIVEPHVGPVTPAERGASRSALPLASEPLFESPVGASEVGASEPSPYHSYHSAFQRGNEPYTADSVQRASEETKNEEMEEVKEFEVSCSSRVQ